VNVEVDDGHGWTFMISMIDAILWGAELCRDSKDIAGALRRIRRWDVVVTSTASTNSPIFIREAEKNDVRQMLSSHDLVAL
jgi:hypothetical protein